MAGLAIMAGRLLRRLRDHLNQRASGERLGYYADDVYKISGRVSLGLGQGGNSLPGVRGGHGGDLILRVRPGHVVHFSDTWVFPGSNGAAADDGAPGGHPGRFIIVWDDEEV